MKKFIDLFFNFISDLSYQISSLVEALFNTVRHRTPGEVYLILKNGHFEYIREPDPEARKIAIAKSKITKEELARVKSIQRISDKVVDGEECHDLTFGNEL